MFGIYARNVMNRTGRYIPDDGYNDKQIVLTYKEGEKLHRCYCKPGDCTASRKCHYTNQLYYNTNTKTFLKLEEFLK